MNVHYVWDRLQSIKAVAGDDEVAHAMEDDLWRDVLRHIANDPAKSEFAALAMLALKTDEIDFRRWCA